MDLRARSVRTGLTAVIAAAALGMGLVSPAAAQEPVPDQKAGPLTPTLQDLATGVSPDGKGRTAEDSEDLLTTGAGRLLVNVRLADTSDASLARLRSAGARIRFVDEQLSTVTVAIAAGKLDALAALSPLVESAQEVLRPMTNAACPSGPFVSEGVTQLKAALARTQFSVTGRDITVGVLSDSYNFLGGANTDVANGELPGAGNPCGNTTAVGNLVEGDTGSIDEGRAMAQIVHDVAPGAKILFASAFLGDLAFAQSIRDLAAQGADVIVDDVTYYTEPMFQDGPIAKAVADVTAQGVVYFSSAANSNVIIGGNRVASYEAPAYRPTSCPASVSAFYIASVTCHNFSTVGTDSTYNINVSSFYRYTLGWNEPQFGVSTDFDVCALNAANALIECATENNLNSQVASEFIARNWAGAASLVVVRYTASGTPRLKLVSHRSDLTSVQFNTSTGGDIVGPTIFGHNASIPGATVAAVPYDNSAVLEDYSSWGPAKYCWGPVVGTTPAAALSPCQTATVDMAATDCGQNSFFGDFVAGAYRFYGTSAAAPHAAALAALMLDKEPCLTPTQVIDTLKTTGHAVGAAPVDGAGGGLVDAVTSLTAASGANCDTQPPAIVSSLSGWYRTPTVSGTVTAKDHRLVTALTCTGGTLSGLNGIGTTQAAGALAVSGEGTHTIACQGSDVEGNTGVGAGSNTPVTVGIDTGVPSVVCRPAKFKAGRPGTVSADVTDALSGPAAATVSAAVTTTFAGTFTGTVTGADVAGNTTSAACAYQVSSVMKGAAKAKAGGSKTYRAIGMPARSKVTWTFKRGSRTLATKRLRSNSSGISAVRIRFPSKGRYVISAKSGGVKAATQVRVK